MDSQNEPSASLRATSNWPGEYNFEISFSSDGHALRKVVHTYSPQLKKLFVQKDVPCPVNFSTDYNMPIGTTIRATAVFSLPDHASDIVSRCVSHAVSDIAIGILHPYHLIRSESIQALYVTDPVNGHYSVIVPYANPHVGECYSTYIYRFVCWGSCAGGLNRRPVTLVFTLENGGQVIGRQSVDVRICACPGRDRRTDEKNFESKISPNPSAPRVQNPQEDDVLNLLKFAHGVKFPAPKKVNIQPHRPDGGYNITATSRGMYDFLRQIEVLYHICNFMRDVPPQVQRIALRSHLKSTKKSSEESDESH